VRADGSRPVSELGEKRRGPGAVGQGFERAKRFFGAAGQPGDHLRRIDSNSFELCDELTNYHRVRHPAPDWGWRRRFTVQRL
jgi:hypothetical protein